MTANAEAQSLLDQLMGADRNALLPTGKKFYGVCVCERKIFRFRRANALFLLYEAGLIC